MLPATREYLDGVFADVVRGPEDLHDYQVEAGDFIYEKPFSALFIDVGMGKTVIIYTLFDRLISEGYEGKILVVAPIRVAARVWMKEHRLWEHTAYLRPYALRITDDDPRLKEAYNKAYKKYRAKYNPDMSVRIAKRIQTKRKEELRQARLDEGLKNGSRIHVIDHGSVDWLVKQCSNRRHWPYKIVVFDEAIGLGDYRNAIFKALKYVRHRIDRFHELTATPASQTYMKLFSLVWMLDEGERFGNFITHFRKRYFDLNPYNRTYELREGSAVAMEKKFADIVFVLMKKERNMLIRTRPIDLGKKAMEQYRQLERTAIIEAPDSTLIEAVNAGNLSSKLLQLASGSVYDENRKAHHFHDAKIEDLKELHEQTLDEPILVAYWFKSSLARLKQAFPKAAVMDREGKMEEPWNKRKFKMMLIHPRSAGHGLNLQAGGHHLVIYDVFWPLDLFLQTIGRLDRQGQTHTVLVHMLSATGTMDETVVEKLEHLQDAQDAMFRRLRELYRRYHRRVA